MDKSGVLSFEEFSEGIQWYQLRKYLKGPCDDYIRIILSERYGVELPEDATRYNALSVLAAREGW